ncbi:MAG TPA: Hpt domain-containing protein [Actinomycetota bacterium]|nr:Hpt domain-containing protein [Actinomycetota bacterium]
MDPYADLRERVAEFKERFPAESFKRICEEFLSATPQLLAELETASREGNSQAVASLAHKLKGSMATFGASRMSDLALRLETGQAGDGLELVEDLKADYSGASRIVAAQLADQAAP